MHPQKVKNIIKLSPHDRYDYFIREVVKLEKVWVVSTGDYWIRLVDYENEEIFPVWPHREVVEICLFEEFKQHEWKIESISLNDFIKEELPDLTKENIILGVFYNKEKAGLAVKPDKLRRDLQNEIEEYL